MLNLLCFPILAGVIGYLLGKAAMLWYVAGDPLEAEILELLPNGQCGQCGLPGCAEAAKAIAGQTMPVNGCPLVSSAVVQQIAAKLGIEFKEESDDSTEGQVAGINPELCDGCGRCAKVCPFDAIIGAPKQLHGIIADACTGCQQCIAICPHEGIALYPDPKLVNPLPKPSLTSFNLGESHV
ncbi:RnfABCDGE type electron transport complex subunit B [Celerinatantimonas sp. YJH-8]|uniref:RnfABCDGE type electron transport complex subunit B n=1 Tax=Celerinatantimonas sp. YJH-8 TaxID=3228714 RepID=UPI0038C84FB9